MARTLSRREPVRLTFRDGEVMVTGEDQDIFFISAAKATEACRNVIRTEERVARFTHEVVLPLKEWCEKHSDQISACYMVFPESSVLPVYMIGASEEYDFALTQDLSELASTFEENGWSVHASQLPKCTDEELRSYFDPQTALVIFG